MAVRHYFLGANTARGFYSLYHEFCTPESGNFLWVLKGGPGGEETFVLGVQDGARAALADGEVYLYSGGASLCLRNDGTIELSGRLVINGAEYAPCACGATGIS